MNPNYYEVFTLEVRPFFGEDANINNLNHDFEDPPPCPLCNSAYINLMGNVGYKAFLECFLGHCVMMEWAEDCSLKRIELTDKPRYTYGLAMEMLVSGDTLIAQNIE